MASAVDVYLDRQLRTITVYMFVLAMCFGVPAGASGASAMVAFGIIPAFFSAVLGTIGLGGGLKSPCLAIPLDSVMIAAYLGFLIPTWIHMSSSYRLYDGNTCRAGGMMLATYATVPIIIDLLIHSYCVARHLPLSIIQGQAVCPNCQHEHQVNNKFHFHPPSTIFPPSTIYTPDDDGEYDDRSSHAHAQQAIGESSTVRPSSEIDGSTLWNGESRHLLGQGHNGYDSKPPGYERQV